MPAKEPTLCDSSFTGSERDRPLLMVDIDGVISLFGGGGAGIGRRDRLVKLTVQTGSSIRLTAFHTSFRAAPPRTC